MQNPYGQEYPRYPQKSANGTLILVLGIIGLAVCGFLGPVAWIMGNNALRDIESGVAARDDLPLVQAGRVLGMITTGILALILCGAGLLVALGGLAAVGSSR